jgi:uncharacterized membrane protein YbhN (UPF0104 family)
MTPAPEAAVKRRGGVIRDLVGVAVSLVSLGAVAWWATKQDRPDFPRSAADLAPLLAALGVYAGITAARGWRWHTILRQVEIPHRRTDAFGLTIVGYMGNNVLPARGGEILRVVLLGERVGGRRRDIIGSIVAERLLDTITLIGLFALMTWAGVAGSPVGSRPVVAALVVGAVGLVSIGVLLLVRRRGRLDRLARVVRPFMRASYALLGVVGLWLLGLTLGVWLLEGFAFWLVGQSLDLDITFLDATFVAVLASLAAALPSAPGYLGTFDAAIVFGLEALDVPGGQAIAFAVLLRFVAFVPITLVGLGLVLGWYGGLPRLRPRGASS